MSALLTGMPLDWELRPYQVVVPAGQWVSLWPQDWVDGKGLQTKHQPGAPTHAIISPVGWVGATGAAPPTALYLRTDSDGTEVEISLGASSANEHSLLTVGALSQAPLRVGQGIEISVSQTDDYTLKVLALHGHIEVWGKKQLALWQTLLGK